MLLKFIFFPRLACRIFKCTIYLFIQSFLYYLLFEEKFFW